MKVDVARCQVFGEFAQFLVDDPVFFRQAFNPIGVYVKSKSPRRRRSSFAVLCNLCSVAMRCSSAKVRRRAHSCPQQCHGQTPNVRARADLKDRARQVERAMNIVRE